MKLLNFHSRSPELGIQLGCVRGERCIDVSRAVRNGLIRFPGGDVSSIEDVLRAADRISRLQDQIENEGLLESSFPLADVRFAPPVLNPQKLIGIGYNYRDHAEETKAPLPKEPLFFAMFASSIIAHLEPVVKPVVSEMLDYEAELAVVIGKRGRKIAREDALDYVAGYTVFNDISARNFHASDSQWLRVKSYDTFAPMGPCMVTRDELGDASGLNIQCRVNGEVRQNSNTRHLIFDVPYLVSYISQVMTLHPGDVISTGTPSGVGMARSPQVFLRAGDVIEVEIEKVGLLRNPVVKENNQ